MPRLPPTPQPDSGFDRSMLINAAPSRVLEAFFDREALSTWWLAAHSIASPRPLGVYAVEWDPTPEADEVLGRLGGIFYGVVVEYRAGRELCIADAWWLPPDGDPIGPMSLEVTCTAEGAACRLRVRQRGFDDSPRWRRYYDVIERGWVVSMAALKEYTEGGS